jgi:hypothetical protein
VAFSPFKANLVVFFEKVELRGYKCRKRTKIDVVSS